MFVSASAQDAGERMRKSVGDQIAGEGRRHGRSTRARHRRGGRPRDVCRRGRGRRPRRPQWTPPSWEQIVRDHSARVYRLAYRLTGNSHDAEDLTQDVFVRVFRSLHTFQPGTFEGWLHRITTNLFLDSARRKQKIRFDGLVDGSEERLPSTWPTPRRRWPTPDSTTTSPPPSPRWPRSSGPPSCSATSKVSRTRRSPRSWTPSSAPSAAASTGVGRSCAPRSPIAARPASGRYLGVEVEQGGAPLAAGLSSIGVPGAFVKAHSCAELAELRSAFVDGALDDADRERLLAHLVDCSDCRREVAELRHVRSLLTGSTDPGLTPVDLSHRLVSIAGDEATEPLWTRPFRRTAGGGELPSRRHLVRTRVLAGVLGAVWPSWRCSAIGYVARRRRRRWPPSTPPTARSRVHQRGLRVPARRSGQRGAAGAAGERELPAPARRPRWSLPAKSAVGCQGDELLVQAGQAGDELPTPPPRSSVSPATTSGSPTPCGSTAAEAPAPSSAPSGSGTDRGRRRHLHRVRLVDPDGRRRPDRAPRRPLHAAGLEGPVVRRPAAYVVEAVEPTPRRPKGRWRGGGPVVARRQDRLAAGAGDVRRSRQRRRDASGSPICGSAPPTRTRWSTAAAGADDRHSSPSPGRSS